jgi:hypothetical protein
MAVGFIGGGDTFSETLVITYKTTWSQIPEDHHIDIFTAVRASNLR